MKVECRKCLEAAELYGRYDSLGNYHVVSWCKECWGVHWLPRSKFIKYDLPELPDHRERKAFKIKKKLEDKGVQTLF